MSLRNTIVAGCERNHGYLPVPRQNRITIEEINLCLPNALRTNIETRTPSQSRQLPGYWFPEKLNGETILCMAQRSADECKSAGVHVMPYHLPHHDLR